MNHQSRGRLTRALATLIALTVASGGCVIPIGPPIRAGLPDFQVDLAGLVRSPGLVSVAGGVNNVASGNFVHRFTDLSLEAGRRTHEIERIYNSASQDWRWNFDMSYDGATFVDATGFVHSGIAEIPDTAPIPGTVWDKVDASRLRTRGGLLHTFDATGRLASVFWDFPGAPGVRYEWGVAQLEIMQCFDETSCILPLIRVEFGPDGPTRIIDARTEVVEGVVRAAEYNYDSGRLSIARSPEDVRVGRVGTAYRYKSGTGLIEAIQTPEGETTAYAWLYGRLALAVRVGGDNPRDLFQLPQRVSGSSDLWSVEHTTPLGGRIRIEFFGDGRWHASRRVDAGELTVAAYASGARRPSFLVGYDGTVQQVIEYRDDTPVKILTATGNLVSATYQVNGINFDDPFARATSEISDTLGLISRTLYDAHGRVHHLENGEGELTQLDFHPGVNVSRVETASGIAVDLPLYGLAQRWIRSINSNLPGIVIERQFDAAGNATVARTGFQRGGVLDRTFDHDREETAIRVAGVDDDGDIAAIATVEIERRSDGKRLRVGRPGNVTEFRFGYDVHGRLAERCEAMPQDGCLAGSTTYWERNGNGQVTAIARPNGEREEWDFDAYGREIAHRAFLDDVLEGEELWSWGGDRIQSYSDSTTGEFTTYQYDVAGRRVESTTQGAGTYTLSEQYDMRSRTVLETYTVDGMVVAKIGTDHDLADREVRKFRVDAAGTEALLVETEFENGRIDLVRYGNGLVRAYEYEPDTGELIGFSMTNEAGETVETTTISRSVEIVPIRYEIRTETETPLGDFGEVYWLNAPGNLQSDAGKLGMRVFRYEALENGSVVDTRRYAWDFLGRRLADADGNQFTYHPGNGRLLNAIVDGESFNRSYDAAGRVSTLDGLEVVRNALGRVTRVGDLANPAVEIGWDMKGRRRVITIGETTRNFELFGGRVERDATTGQLGWLHIGAVSLSLEDGRERYRHADFRGNTLLTSDDSGSILIQRRYQPFGVDVAVGPTGLSEGDLTGFAGGEQIPGLGLVQLSERIYDSVLGQFLSPDPVDDTLNLLAPYSYAYGNPILWWDPSGTNPSPSPATPEAGANQAASIAAAVIDYTGDALLAAAGIAGAQAVRLAVAGPAGAATATAFAISSATLAAIGGALKFVARTIGFIQEIGVISGNAGGGMRKELTIQPEGLGGFKPEGTGNTQGPGTLGPIGGGFLGLTFSLSGLAGFTF